MRSFVFSVFAMTAIIAIGNQTSSRADDKSTIESIQKSLTLLATFDNGPDADVAKGDSKIYVASSAQRKDPKPGLVPGEFEIVKGKGRHGSDALKYVKKSDKVVFFKAAGNVDYQKESWNGSVSFWLNLDPQKDLGDWYCDPIQITEKAWDNGALWVDFSKDEKPKHFRLGAFADLNVWNPDKKNFDKMPASERPMYTVTKPPFAAGKWTHVVFTFENFNTGKANGIAKLYIDGKLQGAVTDRNQRYTWDIEKAAIQLGMGYVGLYDDLALYNRALSAVEIKTLTDHQTK